MKILAATPLAPAALARLRSAGHEVVERPGLEGRALAEALRGTHALVIGGETRVGEEALRGASALRVVARVGVGLDRVDVAAARELGIAVADTPEAPAVAVAEHTIALLLALERHLVRADHAVRSGGWREGLPPPRELAGRSLGLVGFGRVGREVAWRARAFGMDVLWHDPLLDLAPAGYEWARRAVLGELLPRADVLSLHVPLTRATRGLIGARELAAMKSEAVLVNCACGGVVDEDALHAALARGALRGAALDVFAAEPPAGSPLLALPNVVLTPHVAARTIEVARRASLEAAGIVLEALSRARA
ncbi:MAG TPA: hydroxyacid dehydrogenase [Terriglobales bacterium]|nr:hydroxyacid dehydrogenase [Terriglobales bacterium]